MQKTVPFVLVICLFFACIMSAAGWKATLEAADLKKEVVDKILELGYVTDSLFHDAFVDSAAFEKWLCRLRAKVPALGLLSPVIVSYSCAKTDNFVFSGLVRKTKLRSF